jgi:lysine 2,3-aminomutase
MTRRLTRLAELVAAGLVPAERAASLEAVARRYAIAVTPGMAALIDRRNPAADPIGAQFLPDMAELDTRADERADPIGDAAHSPLKGLVHRYPDRVLLMPTLACPVYCRFCFRREAVGPGGAAPDADDLAAAYAYIAARPQIAEVILTGGDPLMLAPRRLAAIADRLAAIDHVGILRVHSRVPVVAPERITAGLVAALRRPGLATYLSVHANHPRELTDAAAAGFARLADAGIVLLSQTVLLRGVNDDPDVLAALFRGLVSQRVRPYYLHHLDPAPGTARFRVPLKRGRAIIAALRGRLTGLAQPTFMLDLPGGLGKAPVGESFAEPTVAGWRVRGPGGDSVLVED